LHLFEHVEVFHAVLLMYYFMDNVFLFSLVMINTYSKCLCCLWCQSFISTTAVDL